MAWPADTARPHTEPRSIPPGLNIARATSRVKVLPPVTVKPT